MIGRAERQREVDSQAGWRALGERGGLLLTRSQPTQAVRVRGLVGPGARDGLAPAAKQREDWADLLGGLKCAWQI